MRVWPAPTWGSTALPSSLVPSSWSARPLWTLKQNSTLQTLLWVSPFASCYTHAAVLHVLLVGGQDLSVPITGSQLDWFCPTLGEMLMFGPYNLPKRARQEAASDHPTTQTRMVRPKHSQCWDGGTRQWRLPSREYYSTYLPVYFLEPNVHSRTLWNLDMALKFLNSHLHRR